VGKTLGAVILGEIGDIRKFDHASKLVAFAGIDSIVNQSGEFEASNNHMFACALFRPRKLKIV
ncbi:MAG: IS110 family transposase, partial [Clostridiales bacterium]|nr:IS110 family transposase [Clostridiales bacterium]